MLKLYTVMTNKAIPSLNGIIGPLTTPTEIDDSAVLQMVKRGYVVYQHNPNLQSEKVRVTIDNFSKVVFPTTKDEALRKLREEKEAKEAAKGLKISTVRADNNTPQTNVQPAVTPVTKEYSANETEDKSKRVNKGDNFKR